MQMKCHLLFPCAQCFSKFSFDSFFLTDKSSLEENIEKRLARQFLETCQGDIETCQGRHLPVYMTLVKERLLE